jgi:hypothetical protein
MINCFQQSYTIKTPVTTIIFDPIDKPTVDDIGIFSLVLLCCSFLFNQKDQSAGIFFKEIDGGMEWLWSLIEETVDLYINDNKEFSKRGGEQSFDGQQRRAILKIPMSSTVGLYSSRLIFLIEKMTD